MDGLVRHALDAEPRLRAAEHERDRAALGVDLAGTGYLPRVESLLQVNRAALNNVFGMLLPQSTIPAIAAGPPAAMTSPTSASVEVTRLELAVAAGDAFLTLLAAEEFVKAAAAGLERTRTLETIVGAQLADGERQHIVDQYRWR